MLATLRIDRLALQYGTQKFFNFRPSPNPGPPLVSLFALQEVLELVGGSLILMGLFTCPIASILAGDMTIAYFMAHAPRSFFPAVNGGHAAVLFASSLCI